MKEFYKKYFMRQKMMHPVIYSLIPIALAATYFYGLRVLALLITNVLIALFVEYLSNKKILKKGDKVTINGPYGDFYYHDDDTEIILGAAKTGFAPIRSILNHMKDHDIKRKARFYFGARIPDDLFLLDELKDFEETLYDFKFIPVLSRTMPEMNWEGDTGHADDAIRKYCQETGKNSSAYLYGSPK